MATYITGGWLSFERPFSTLLRYDGTEYAGGTICNQVRIPAERSNVEIIERANNEQSFSEMGKRVGRMLGMEVMCFTEAAVAQINSDTGREMTGSVFLLERPGPPWSPETPGRRYYLRIYDFPFEPANDNRRSQRIAWHKADLTQAATSGGATGGLAGIEVLKSEPLDTSIVEPPTPTTPVPWEPPTGGGGGGTVPVEPGDPDLFYPYLPGKPGYV